MGCCADKTYASGSDELPSLHEVTVNSFKDLSICSDSVYDTAVSTNWRLELAFLSDVLTPVKRSDLFGSRANSI